MKKKRLKHLTAWLCALTLILTLVPTASAAQTPVSSTNINKEDYTTYGSTVTSYLYENSQGGVTRVEYLNGNLVVEDYDRSYNLANSRTIRVDLPLWGGFFAGEDANYVISGQPNSAEDNRAEVIRVVKYSKDWTLLGTASLRGANTTIPFISGSLRCDEYAGYLYIRTCHQMYKSSDGLNHQSNLTMSVRESDMEITDSYYRVMNISDGYVSHSFNEFILVDQNGKLVTLDHGDAYPRGAVLCQYYADASTGKFTDGYVLCQNSTVQSFGGAVGNNNTGASLGGLAETSSGYVSVYNYDGVGGSSRPRDVYLGFTSGSLSSSARKISNSSGVTTPVLAPTGLDGGYVLWNGKSGYSPDDVLYYTTYSSSGTAGSVQTANASLSDCQPIYHNGQVVWYVTNNSAPVFYGLNSSGVTVLNNSSPPPIDPEPTDPEPGKPGGKIEASVTYAANGEEVTLTILPDDGCELNESTFIVTGSNGQTIHPIKKQNNVYTFRMPACDVVVHADFIKQSDPGQPNPDLPDPDLPDPDLPDPDLPDPDLPDPDLPDPDLPDPDLPDPDLPDPDLPDPDLPDPDLPDPDLPDPDLPDPDLPDPDLPDPDLPDPDLPDPDLPDPDLPDPDLPDPDLPDPDLPDPGPTEPGSLTFMDGAAILENGSVVYWNNKTMEVIGNGYKALNSNFYIDRNDAAWELRTSGDFLHAYPYAEDVQQITINGTILKKDGTVWSPTKYAGMPEDSSSTLFYITDNAKQVWSTQNRDNAVNYILKNDGSLWSWKKPGNNEVPDSLLGRDDGTQGGYVRKVMDDVAFVTAGMAIKTDGSLWSWGSRDMVGDGSSNMVYAPVRIMEDVADAWSINGGAQRFALKKDGTLWSWGYNGLGESTLSDKRIGNNYYLGYLGGNKIVPGLNADDNTSIETYYQTVPRQVDIDNVCAVSFSNSSVIYQKTDGSLWAIGAVAGLPNFFNEDAAFRADHFVKILDGVKLCGIS